MFFCGIDAGKTGAIAILDKDGNIQDNELFDCPADLFHEKNIYEQLESLFSKYENIRVLIERPTPRPKINSVVGAFSSGVYFGILKACLVSLKISYEEIPPSVWAKEIFKSLPVNFRKGDTKKKDKEKSKILAVQLWPNQDFRATSRSKKIHDGLTDSALIAEYNRRRNIGGLS